MRDTARCRRASCFFAPDALFRADAMLAHFRRCCRHVVAAMMPFVAIFAVAVTYAATSRSHRRLICCRHMMTPDITATPAASMLRHADDIAAAI